MIFFATYIHTFLRPNMLTDFSRNLNFRNLNFRKFESKT